MRQKFEQIITLLGGYHLLKIIHGGLSCGKYSVENAVGYTFLRSCSGGGHI